eukprot:TRINITY_DN22090_c0_g3_i3.p1 TRINITY_DN22090_c0_g3~~TRINITY_DN22090_c0_g3_i3.p1  ORF type:complete len:113 (+),score=20.86 TRINITY_DN22090_c0_g3_i3:430-768(+)
MPARLGGRRKDCGAPGGSIGGRGPHLPSAPLPPKGRFVAGAPASLPSSLQSRGRLAPKAPPRHAPPRPTPLGGCARVVNGGNFTSALKGASSVSRSPVMPPHPEKNQKADPV